MDKSEFFIGWKGQLSSDQKHFLLRFFKVWLILGVVLIIGFVLFQKSFNNHIFQLGNQEIVTGIYYDKPVPILIADTLHSGLSLEILLVGYGKFGAEGIVSDIKSKYGDLNGKRIKIQGTLIHGDGKTLMELTEKSESIMDVFNTDPHIPKNSFNVTSSSTLSGEILDPKCYFGVMKPGEGKVHKSCAIRCISGGIPPVFRTEGKDGYAYYIILGKDGRKINHELLDYVAEQISIEGEIREMNGWNFLYCDPTGIKLQ